MAVVEPEPRQVKRPPEGRVAPQQARPKPQPEQRAVPPQPASGTPIVIRNDGGGNVPKYVARRADLAASGRPIEIRDKCNSACTILITLPNACVAPDAQIGFHRPNSRVKIAGADVLAEALWTEQIGGYYRNGVRREWDRKWSLSKEYTVISGKRYVELDPQTRLCSG